MNITATVTSTTSIVVSWEEIPAIELNSPIAQYEVQFSQSTFGGAPVNGSGFTTDASVLTVTLDNLEEFVEYSIAVRGITVAGPGPLSEAIFNTTFEDCKPIKCYFNCSSYFIYSFLSLQPLPVTHGT